MKNEFTKLLKELNMELTNQQYSQFETYYKLLTEWNNKINLTAITDYEEVYIKHFYDSLTLTKAIQFENQTLLDVGSGAGFPSIPLKIMFPNLKITIIDALKKRIDFLSLLTEVLELDVNLIHGRAENQKTKESFDLVTARAVANLNILSELCLPFVKVGGNFLVMKGSKGLDEFNNAKHAIIILGGVLENTKHFDITGETRIILNIQKRLQSPNKYPRAFKHIKKQPL